MKAAILGLIMLFVLLAAGIGFYVFLNQSKSNETTFSSQNVTKIGKIQKITPPGDDYTHLLLTSDGIVKLNTQIVDLNTFEGKTVQVIGQYSGNTLFVDAIEEQR